MNSHIITAVEDLVPKGPKVIVAVSGGVDSMTLATAALMAGVSFDVAHVNFSLRGKESDLDESLVRSWCEEHGITCHVKTFDTAAYAASEGISIEMAARRLRYDWFATLGKVVLVAHNANDNAETLLLNLCRGTGIRGLCGMKSISDMNGLMVIRPFLDITRAEIECFAAEHKVPFRVDSSNADVSYKRNRIRHQVIPQLEEINPFVVRTISQNMARFRDVSSIADDYFNSSLGGLVPGPEGLKVSLELLLGHTHQEYLLYRLMAPYGFNSQDVEALLGLILSRRQLSGKVFRSVGFVAYIAEGSLVIEPLQEGGIKEVSVTGEGEWACGRYRLMVSVEEVPSGLKTSDGSVILDFARLGFPFTLRPWRDGDWMCPLGMGGRRRKVSDVLVSLKIPSARKNNLIMLAFPGQEGRIGAIVGHGRIDEELAIVPGVTKKVIRILVCDGPDSKD